MEQNPDELQVTELIEQPVEPPKRARKRVPKKALEQIKAIEETSTASKERAQKENETETVVLEEPKPVTKVPSHQVLKCECGCDIMPEANGMYPARCPECGTWNDYRGVKFLEQSDTILVCDKCGGLTLLTPETVCCEHCGAR